MRLKHKEWEEEITLYGLWFMLKYRIMRLFGKVKKG